MSQRPIREAYTHLAASFSKKHKLSHALAMLNWDSACNLPPGSGKARGEACATLEVLIHDELVHPSNVEKLDFLKQQQDQIAQTLSELEQANLREMKRAIEAETKLPPELVERKSKLANEAELAWRVARKANDWATMEPLLEKIFDAARETGEYLKAGGASSSSSTYEALLDQYEPGMKVADVDAVFNELKSWLPAAIKARVAAQGTLPALPQPERKYPVDKQKALSRAIMESLNFDFTRGRADVSSHPMCAGVPEDVRITNRYFENEFESGIMGVVHETGHSKYEQGRPADVIDQPVSLARSMGVHESQSLLHEMHLGRSRAFQTFLQPLLKQHLDVDVDPDVLQKRAIFVKSDNKIRVDADEMTYPLHVILRYEIERGVIERTISVKDIPAIWDAKMMEYFGIDTKGDFTNGCLQDIHWNFGAVGYFPTYTLGAMYASQIVAAIRRSLGSDAVDEQIAKGDFTAIHAWLQKNVWSHGSRYETPQLIELATGEPFTSKYFKEHIAKRYSA